MTRLLGKTHNFDCPELFQVGRCSCHILFVNGRYCFKSIADGSRGFR